MKNLTVAVCVDDNGGMTFNNRRQSRDRMLISELCATSKAPVFISPFSRILFTDAGSARECEHPLVEAPNESVVFIENLPLLPHINDIKTLIIYRWNRSYPRDTYLDVDPIKHDFSLVEAYDFVGSSHEKITKEIYKK